MSHQLPLLAAPKQALQAGLQEEAGQNLNLLQSLALPVSLMPTPSSQAGLPCITFLPSSQSLPRYTETFHVINKTEEGHGLPARS